MLTNEQFTINNLVQLSAGGLICADFTQIKAALIDRYRAIYGSDIDIDDTTADGVFINNIGLAINNILRSFEVFYQNLDVKNASGPYLDILCALTNITRKPATNSNTTLELEYFGDDEVTYLIDDLIFIDKAGLEWKMTSNLTFSTKNEKKSVYVECVESGPITAPVGWINSTLEVSPLIGIKQTTAANVGNDVESDVALRSRQQRAGSGAGITVLDGLSSALLSISGIEDVYIRNEPDDTPLSSGSPDPTTLADETTQYGHSIYVVIRQAAGITIDDSTVGELIYSKLTPGISTSVPGTKGGTTKTYEHVETVNGIYSSSLDTQNVYWKLATPYTNKITIIVNPYEYFSKSELDTVAALMKAYLNNLPIGYNPTNNEISMKMIEYDPQFKGVATYYLGSVSFQTSNPNPLTYFDYSVHEVTYNESSNNYTLTLS